jgi:hypothetical protein
MNTICLKCGAGKASLKCDFCGSEESIEERKESESSSKIIAYREYEIGNYSESLKAFNRLYKEYPNDIYVIAYKSFCNYHNNGIDNEELSKYLSVIFNICKDDSVLQKIISKFSQVIKSYSVFQSILTLINKQLIEKIFNNENLYLYLKNIVDQEINDGNSVRINFHLFKNIYNSKSLVSRTLYDDFVKYLISKDILYAGKGQYSSDYFEISDSEFLELLSFANNGFLPRTIFRYYFVIQENNTSIQEWEHILLKLKPEFISIKDQIEYQVNEALNGLKYFKDGNSTNWKYSYSMNIEIVRDNLKRILKKGEKKSTSSGCFIATATMGSYDHPVVVDLRIFRDNCLLTKKWGISFVNWYYTHGPKAARLINKSKVLKYITFIAIVKPLHHLSKILRIN